MGRIKIIKDGYPSPVGNGKYFKSGEVVILDEPFQTEAMNGGYAIRWFPEDEENQKKKLAQMEANQKVNKVIKETKKRKK